MSGRATALTWLSTLAAAVLLAPLAALAGQTTAPQSPLLELAARQHYAAMAHAQEYRAQLDAAQYELGRNPPPAAQCSATLAAPRFAASLASLAEARAGLGDQAGAIAAYEAAIGCAPRRASLRGDLCIERMNLGSYAPAREAADRGLRLDARDYGSNACLAQLDYLARRWSAAIPRIRFLVARADDTTLASYWQILLWLAQRRSGVSAPALAARELETDWPRPILDYLRGRRDERALAAELGARTDGVLRREQLCEALYYVGQARLAGGEGRLARAYFAAAVNLKVLYFTEHHLALAALDEGAG